MDNHFNQNEYSCKGKDCCGNTAVVDKEHKRRMNLLREDFGSPIFVSSGFRCVKHNDEVGGVPGSNHTNGNAWDIYPEDPNRLEELHKKAKIYFGECIFYKEKGFVHAGNDLK